MPTMTPTEAAKIWLEWRARMDPLKDQEKQAEAAADVLKEYFDRTGKLAFRGVGYKVDEFEALDTKLAKEKLGKRVTECMVNRKRKTLFPLKPAEAPE